MSQVIDQLIDELLAQYKIISKEPKRYIVGITGIPGSGKSTVSTQLTNRLNAKAQQEQLGEIAVLIPMDGYHKTRAELDVMEDPQNAHARRGSHWTFNPELLVTLLHKLRNYHQYPDLYAPSFDHKAGDPVENDIYISKHHFIIIVEGLYLNLEEPAPWNQIPALLDESWFIPISIDASRKRTSQRHFQCGLTDTLEKGIERYNNNDILNAEFVLNHMTKTAKVIDTNKDTM
ncbi:P-loop containing nucleoside triphosphate hydrolase protein [Backusella circina FSU 941]|nr:P-loop containing nucleoside triphosphate hydrolase protein [Backusella circina FSU 941]